MLFLARSLYGLKQAPHAWFQRFAGYATRAGFYHSRCDSSLFIYKQGSQVAYLLIYVDDIILTTSCPAPLQQIIGSLNNEFDMTDLGALSYFLGISADRTLTGLFLSQKKYDLQLLERAHMVTCNPSRTPIDTESKLGLEGVPVEDPTLYRSLAGGLQYLTFTRPDLSYAVQQICLYMHDLRDPHFASLKRCPSTRRSTLGYCVFLGDNILSWSAKRQHTISRSSAEAKYRGVANVVAETAWIRNLLRELHSPISTATLVYCDNVSVVYMSANPVQHQRTKHIEIDIHFIRDVVTAGHVRVLHVPSRFYLYSPTTAVNHHHRNSSMLTLHHIHSTNLIIISPYTTKWVSSSSLPLNSKIRCGALSPRPPDSGPPSDDDQDTNSGSVASFSRLQESVQIFFAVLFWMSLFFWSSVWDGSNNGRSDKGPRFWK
nr:copia protein [Tanacetum cinerariifolium]